MRILLYLALSISLVACTSDGTKYTTKDGVARERAQAERAFAESPAVSVSGAGPLDHPIKAIYAPFPSYPPQLRSRGIEGKVRTVFVIREDGSVSDARVVGAPDPALVAISLNAILRWRFEPLTRQGKPVRAQATQEFKFELK